MPPPAATNSARALAEKLGVDAHKMLEMNRSVYAGMTATTKLMSGTLLKLPARAGSGSSAKVMLFAKVQSSKTYTLTLRESDPVRMIKRLVGEKESISVKEQTVVLSGQQLDDKLTVSDYNLSDDVLVNVHVYGADMFEGQATGEVEEVEYDSSWIAGVSRTTCCTESSTNSLNESSCCRTSPFSSK